jgi:hypothetical protein
VIDNTAQVRIVWANGGTPFAVNVLHGIKDDPLSAVDAARAQTLADALQARLAAVSTTSKSNLRTSITLGQVGIRDLNSPNNAEFIATPGTAFGFSGSTELLPLNVAACVTLRTAKAGQRYRGRVYLSGWTEGASVAGLMSDGAKTASTDIVSAMNAALDDAGLSMSVASRINGTSQAVTSIVARDNVWDTQRRRIIPGI